MKDRCFSYEGCRGEGWLWDSCDSGSGAQVYCDCQAGQYLKRRDDAEMAARSAPKSRATTKKEG